MALAFWHQLAMWSRWPRWPWCLLWLTSLTAAKGKGEAQQLRRGNVCPAECGLHLEKPISWMFMQE